MRPLPRQADLSLFALAPPAVPVGATGGWSVHAFNAGPRIARSVELMVTVTGATIEGAADAAGALVCETPSAGAIHCTTPALAPLATVGVVVNIRATGDVGEPITTFATVRMTATTQVDPTPSNNTVTQTAFVTTNPPPPPPPIPSR